MTATSLDIHKSVSRIAALVVAGADIATAYDYAERMKEFSDEVFEQVIDSVSVTVRKSVRSTSLELTTDILKAKYHR